MTRVLRWVGLVGGVGEKAGTKTSQVVGHIVSFPGHTVSNCMAWEHGYGPH